MRNYRLLMLPLFWLMMSGPAAQAQAPLQQKMSVPEVRAFVGRAKADKTWIEVRIGSIDIPLSLVPYSGVVTHVATDGFVIRRFSCCGVGESIRFESVATLRRRSRFITLVKGLSLKAGCGAYRVAAFPIVLMIKRDLQHGKY
jgi:hypothetical protein